MSGTRGGYNSVSLRTSRAPADASIGSARIFAIAYPASAARCSSKTHPACYASRYSRTARTSNDYTRSETSCSAYNRTAARFRRFTP